MTRSTLSSSVGTYHPIIVVQKFNTLPIRRLGALLHAPLILLQDLERVAGWVTNKLVPIDTRPAPFPWRDL
jgi:hypothetical protein